MNTHRRAADRLLGHLGLERAAPSLDYLHRLIRAHQIRVPFETLTKITDYEPGLARGDFLPPFDDYADRIVSRGAGGLCWTLARGFHLLVADLGFDASLMLMEPGHCCVRVELPEGAFYADVGYAAPIFRAYPLFESFTIDSPRERFDYRVGEDGIHVTRTPGPAKKLDPTPRTLESLRDLIVAANDWTNPESFLRRLAFSGYAQGVYTRLNGVSLHRHLPGGLEVTTLAPGEARDAIARIFGADPSLYVEAAAIHRRYCPQPRTEVPGARPQGAPGGPSW